MEAERRILSGPELSFGNRSGYPGFNRPALHPIGRAPGRDIAVHFATVSLLRSSIRNLLPYERPTIERLAPKMGVSVRTLQRRLRNVGVTFEKMIDEIRCDHALNLLENESMPLTEVAFVLGYSDIAHFTRAFKRWVGLTPTGFRAILREGQHAAL
jgi:AraC-like DNA-binding protein